MSDIMTSKEKEHAKRIGKFYLKLIKMMGIAFLVGLILSGAALATSKPNMTMVHLDTGESRNFSQFYGEAGDQIQYAFAITHENGQEYQYNTEVQYNDDHGEQYYSDDIDGIFELYEYMQQMEWYVQVDLVYSESIDFADTEVIKSVSGEINIVNFELYQSGFYRLEITNKHTEVLDIGIAKSEANLLLVGSAVTTWIVFGVIVGLFSLAVHIGFWLLVIYLCIKAFNIMQEDNRRSHPNVIGPQEQSGSN